MPEAIEDVRIEPYSEEWLRKETHKGGTDTLHQRILYTLTDRFYPRGQEPPATEPITPPGEDPDAHFLITKLAKVVSELMVRMHAAGLLTEDQFDNILARAKSS